MATIPIHPLANIFPMLRKRQRAALAEDIGERGLLHPIVLHDDMILDGRNRYEACLEVGVEPRFDVYEGDDPLGHVMALNSFRRHLNDGARQLAAAQLANISRGGDRRPTKGPIDTLKSHMPKLRKGSMSASEGPSAPRAFLKRPVSS
jgi:ParB-like chromosome segregation protein Spo0J